MVDRGPGNTCDTIGQAHGMGEGAHVLRAAGSPERPSLSFPGDQSQLLKASKCPEHHVCLPRSPCCLAAVLGAQQLHTSREDELSGDSPPLDSCGGSGPRDGKAPRCTGSPTAAVSDAGTAGPSALPEPDRLSGGLTTQSNQQRRKRGCRNVSLPPVSRR